MSEPSAAYLKTLPAVRERCTLVHNLAKEGRLQYFDYHPEKRKDVINFCVDIIQRDFGQDVSTIPPHSRWRHFDTNRPRIAELISTWNSVPSSPSEEETCKRLLDLFLVSVLLDAGAGNAWKYVEKGTSHTFARSEGLAVASLDMFKEGFFSSRESHPYQVDAHGLESVTLSKMTSAFQVDDGNPMNGLEGRTNILLSLATALRASPNLFGDDGRPGNLLDFLSRESTKDSATGKTRIHISKLFQALIEGLSPIWPARVKVAGNSLGDVWHCGALQSSDISASETYDLVPFHKLTQWLAYSLVEPIESVLGWKIEGMEMMTGLPEYRNGGLLVDHGLLSLKTRPLSGEIPSFDASHPAIVEWRAMTVIELDLIAEGIRQTNPHFSQLSLAQVLESATWKGGREIARLRRPETGGPPIEILSDGTVF